MYKVLIVEDEVPMLNALSDKFMNEGYTVINAQDGEEGLAKAFKEKPNLIIMDLLMPKMDGMKVMKELRKDVWGMDVPIIILTNLPADDEIMVGVIDDSPCYYLVKANTGINDILSKAKTVLYG